MAATDHDQGKRLLTPWVYDLGLSGFGLALDIFFREVYPRSAFRVPPSGPVIIVVAPHANQFVDSIVLMRILKQHAGRRVSFLIAEKSMKEPYIGALAGKMGALPVARAMDKAKPGKGTVFLPEPETDALLVRGVDTDFEGPDFMVGGSLILPKVSKEAPETLYIAEINSATELRIRKAPEKPETFQQLVSPGTTFKIAPHIDQSAMFDAVFRELSHGACIGIFPEGGSHDRADLLPLKAGVAIMALGALARDPKCGLTIIPCGMNYFHPHKFRSRAVIDFGAPIDVHPDQIAAYKLGGPSRRAAISSLLETVYDGLATVTQPAPDHETLQLVQATRRLYNPLGRKLPLPVVIKFNRRLLKGYTQTRDDPRVVRLKRAVLTYNRNLRALGIKDHQVEWGDTASRPWWLTLVTLLYRLAELAVLALGTLPGLLLFWPVFATAKVISVRKRRAALAASVVKVQGKDVVATWKILVALGLAPALYVWYTAVVSLWLVYNRKHGAYSSALFPPWALASSYVPASVPVWAFSAFFFGLMIAITFAALRIGEIGMDILKSLPPLLVALNPWSKDSLVELREQRRGLAAEVKRVIDELGPEVFERFDGGSVGVDTYGEGKYQSRLRRGAGEKGD